MQAKEKEPGKTPLPFNERGGGFQVEQDCSGAGERRIMSAFLMCSVGDVYERSRWKCQVGS